MRIRCFRSWIVDSGSATRQSWFLNRSSKQKPVPCISTPSVPPSQLLPAPVKIHVSRSMPPTLVPRSRSSFPPYRKHGNYAHTAPQVNNAGVLGVTTDVGDPATLQETLAGMDGMERAEWLRQRTTQTAQDAEDCLRINYHGNKTVTEALLPLLRSSSDGRIVNVTSAWGLLRYFSGDELRRELDDVANLTTQRLDEMSGLFLEDLGTGNGALERRGWPADPVYAAYMASKALVCAYTRVIAREEGAALRVNCVHPGYVVTGMNDYTGILTAAEGAAAAVVVALAEKGGVTGAYFDRTELGASFV
ncbi:short-chain dehydrogenase/reductase 2b isoform X3 [Triticum aestivum]|uniref:short-chain dehydrogenase/reductase 2b isoform X3 n=1 Tax=Triticum aestivum TaxID=4565 RepID=UPI001D01A73E|nr:short-chain dehydrogenase/reductase 2b-like isoform X3 [Triticum aestivum]